MRLEMEEERGLKSWRSLVQRSVVLAMEKVMTGGGEKRVAV